MYDVIYYLIALNEFGTVRATENTEGKIASDFLKLCVLCDFSISIIHIKMVHIASLTIFANTLNPFLCVIFYKFKQPLNCFDKNIKINSL